MEGDARAANCLLMGQCCKYNILVIGNPEKQLESKLQVLLDSKPWWRFQVTR